MKARRGVLGTLVMAGGDLCAMARTLCGRSTLLGKRGLNALGRAAATLLTQERHAQNMNLEIAADTAWPTRFLHTKRLESERTSAYRPSCDRFSKSKFASKSKIGTTNEESPDRREVKHAFPFSIKIGKKRGRPPRGHEKRCPFPLASLCPRRVPCRPSLTRDSERIALSDKHGQAQQEHQAQVHPPERHAPRDRRGREGQVPLARGARELLPSARP
jgi:hypothetical protein